MSRAGLLVGVGVAGLGVAALVYGASRTPKGRELLEEGGELLDEGQDRARRAWAALQGVDVPARLSPFLDALQDAVSFDVTITSGTRTAGQQARAMASKIQRGHNLYELYAQDDLVSEILAVIGSTTSPDVAAMAEVIADQVARGRFISRHLRDDALDVRTRNLSADQVAELVATVEQLGGEALDEGDHVHLEDLPEYPLQEAA